MQALEELLKVHLAQGYLSQAIQDAKDRCGWPGCGAWGRNPDFVPLEAVDVC